MVPPGQEQDWAHAKAVVGVRQARHNTLEEAFQSFKMDVEVKSPEYPSGTMAENLHDSLLEEDMLLALLGGPADDDGPQQTCFLPHAGAHGVASHHEAVSTQTGALYIGHEATSQAQYAYQSPYYSSNMFNPHPDSNPYPIPDSLLPAPLPPPPSAPALPPMPPAPRITNKYAAAVGAALGFSLPDDSCAMKLAGTGEIPDEAIHDRVASLDMKLQDAVCELLIHLAYTPAKAKAIAQGDTAKCADVEARGLQKLLNHKRDILNLFTDMLRETTTVTGTATNRRQTADSAHTGHAAGSGTTTPVSSHGGVWGGRGDASTSTSRAKMQAECCTRLALSLETDQWLLERFRRQLSTCACQLWALMNLVDPHPSRQVKDGLATYTGKSLKQISDWFTNWRARHWKKFINNV